MDPVAVDIFVSFDATEYNLAGAAEWIENRRSRCSKKGMCILT